MQLSTLTWKKMVELQRIRVPLSQMTFFGARAASNCASKETITTHCRVLQRCGQLSRQQIKQIREELEPAHLITCKVHRIITSGKQQDKRWQKDSGLWKFYIKWAQLARSTTISKTRGGSCLSPHQCRPCQLRISHVMCPRQCVLFKCTSAL